MSLTPDHQALLEQAARDPAGVDFKKLDQAFFGDSKALLARLEILNQSFERLTAGLSEVSLDNFEDELTNIIENPSVKSGWYLKAEKATHEIAEGAPTFLKGIVDFRNFYAGAAGRLKQCAELYATLSAKYGSDYLPAAQAAVQDGTAENKDRLSRIEGLHAHLKKRTTFCAASIESMLKRPENRVAEMREVFDTFAARLKDFSVYEELQTQIQAAFAEESAYKVEKAATTGLRQPLPAAKPLRLKPSGR